MSNKFKLLLAIAGVIIFWSFATPIFEFPDEQAHVESVEFLVKNNRMPFGKEWDMTEETMRTQTFLGNFRDNYGNNKYTYHPEYHVEYTDTLIGKYEAEIIALRSPSNRDHYVAKEAARYPRLYYDFVGLFYRALQDQDIILRTYVMRLGNVVLSIATIYFIYQIGLLIFNKKSFALILAAMATFQPMFSFLSAGVNSDNLHILLYTIFIYYCLRFIISGWAKINLFIFTLVIIADFYTKPQAYVMAPILFLAFILRWLVYKTFKVKWKKVLALGILVLIGILPKEGQTLLALVWRGRVPYSYSPKIASTPPNFLEFVKFSINKFYAQNMVWYWGLFKWLGIVLPRIWWWIANRLALLSGIGLLIGIFRTFRQTKGMKANLPIIFLAGACATYMFAIFWFDWQYAKGVGYSIGVQARYYFPVISTQLSIMLYGLLAYSWNKNSQIMISRIVLLFFVALQIAGMYTLLSSYYDLTSISSFITQASQYKPAFAKGNWWYLWGGLYIISILYLTWIGMVGVKDKKSFLDRRKL